jgi:hypothetical protein
MTDVMGKGLVLLIVACGFLMLISVNVPDVGSVELGSHAVERHGNDALRAREAVTNGSPGGHWKCDGDKEYMIRYVAEAHEWAVMIIRSGYEITSFTTTDQGYIKGVLEQDGCVQEWNFSHP